MFEVLRASAKEGDETQNLFSRDDLQVTLQRGDHAVVLKKTCECLEEARKYATSSPQELTISNLIQSFKTGDMETYRDSQRIWINNRNPGVEKVLGFAEPTGIRMGFRHFWRHGWNCWCQGDKGLDQGLDQAHTTKSHSGIYHGRTVITQTKIEAWVRSRWSVWPAKFHKPTRSDFMTAEWMEFLTLTSSYLVISYCFSIFLRVNLPNVRTSPF